MVARATEERIAAEIVQGIIHPAHIPLVIEAQSAKFYRTGNTVKVSGILCNQHCIWMQLVQTLIHAF